MFICFILNTFHQNWTEIKKVEILVHLTFKSEMIDVTWRKNEMTHTYEVRMRFHEAELWVMVPILGEKFSFMHVDKVRTYFALEKWVFCCKFRNSGKFGNYLVDSVLKIEKAKFVMSTIDVGRNNKTKLLVTR